MNKTLKTSLCLWGLLVFFFLGHANTISSQTLNNILEVDVTTKGHQVVLSIKNGVGPYTIKYRVDNKTISMKSDGKVVIISNLPTGKYWFAIQDSKGFVGTEHIEVK